MTIMDNYEGICGHRRRGGQNILQRATASSNVPIVPTDDQQGKAMFRFHSGSPQKVETQKFRLATLRKRNKKARTFSPPIASPVPRLLTW